MEYFLLAILAASFLYYVYKQTAFAHRLKRKAISRASQNAELIKALLDLEEEPLDDLFKLYEETVWRECRSVCSSHMGLWPKLNGLSGYSKSSREYTCTLGVLPFRKSWLFAAYANYKIARFNKALPTTVDDRHLLAGEHE